MLIIEYFLLHSSWYLLSKPRRNEHSLELNNEISYN